MATLIPATLAFLALQAVIEPLLQGFLLCHTHKAEATKEAYTWEAGLLNKLYHAIQYRAANPFENYMSVHNIKKLVSKIDLLCFFYAFCIVVLFCIDESV